jgi:hypothetical protein
MTLPSVEASLEASFDERVHAVANTRIASA